MGFKVCGETFMGPKSEEGELRSDSSSSDDLLTLLQRLKESVSVLQEDGPRSNSVNGATEILPEKFLSSHQEKNDSIVYLDPALEVAESDRFEDRDSDRIDTHSTVFLAARASSISDNWGCIEAVKSQELEISEAVPSNNNEPVTTPDNEGEYNRLSASSGEAFGEGTALALPVEVDSTAEINVIEIARESLEVSTVDNGQFFVGEPETTNDPWQNGGWEQSQPERPERYANPTRIIPLGGEARNRQRVISNSNLVGAPPPQAPVGGYKFQQRPGARIKDVLKDPVVSVVVLIALMVIVIIAVSVSVSVSFIFNGSNKVQRKVLLPSVSVVQGLPSTLEKTRVYPTQTASSEEITGETVLAKLHESIEAVDSVVQEGKVIGGANAEVIAREQDKESAKGKGKGGDEVYFSALSEIEDSEYRWIIEIAALTKQSDYERLMIQLQKDGFHPFVRVDKLSTGVDVFRLELREFEMKEALVRISQLKRLKYIEPKQLVIKPANESKGK